MRNAMAGIAGMVAVLSGCAAHHLPERMISTQWETVGALPMGTNVAVYIGTDTPRTGRIQHVTADVLALRERSGLSMIPRPQVERVSTREPTGTRQWPHVLEGGLIGAAAAVPVALLVSAHDEQGTGHAAPLVAALLGAGLGAVAGSTRAPEQTFRERIIYIRP